MRNMSQMLRGCRGDRLARKKMAPKTGAIRRKYDFRRPG
jgi:hypothetical protein